MADNSTVSSEEDYDYEEFVAPEGLLIFAGFVIIFMILLAVMGNLLTIMSFVRDKHLRITYNIYLANLAVADLIIGAISMAVYLSYTLRKDTWIYGYHFCKVYLVMDFLACTVTVILMNVISYDRLMLLKQGASYYMNQTTKNAIIKITLSWLLGFILYGPAIIGWDHWTGENIVEDDDCDVQFAHSKAYTTTTAILEFFIPLITLGIINAFVIKEIRQLRHNRVNVQAQVSTVLTHVSESGNETKNENSKKPKQTPSTKARRAARSLALLVFAFFVTWAPYTILTVITSFCEECISIPVYETFTYILWFKAAFNPFLYVFNSQRFRENFLFFLCCGKRPLRIT